MSVEVKIHAAQTSILRALLFSQQATYAKLQKPTNLSSDHFNFHINRLVELGFVEKVSRGTYMLTARGKEYANRLDTDNNEIERQPKSAVIIGIQREHEGSVQYVFQQRLKQPYYGFWGLPSGKIRWGESILETAAREGLEETGLSAEYSIASVYHEHVAEAESNIIIEDKIFFIVLGKNPSGELIDTFEGGHNEWLTTGQVMLKDKKYATLLTEVDLLSGKKWFLEQTVSYSKTEF